MKTYAKYFWAELLVEATSFQNEFKWSTIRTGLQCVKSGDWPSNDALVYRSMDVNQMKYNVGARLAAFTSGCCNKFVLKNEPFAI